jgi:2-polyprenyl-3-methyl-5-hydroxy-6-metoxy-1,4-benzoquinol methylase
MENLPAQYNSDMDEPSPHEWPELSDDVRAAWNQNAGFWDEVFGEGNEFHLTLIGPAVERLLALQPGEMALDVACGNGAFARRMAALGAVVVACDFSESFLERARAHPVSAGKPVEYQQVDATDRSALLALGEGRFDALVCNMALMDMPAIEPLFESAARLLRPGGRFVFSILHPCFNSIYTHKLLQESDADGKITVERALKLTGYIHAATRRGLGIVGQPVPQLYFHRPLSVLLQTAFRQGFVLDGCEEPVFPEGAQGDRVFSWEAFAEFPPVFAARLRLPG